MRAARPGVGAIAGAVEHVLAQLGGLARQVTHAVVEQVAVDREHVGRGERLEERTAPLRLGTIPERVERRGCTADAAEQLADGRHGLGAAQRGLVVQLLGGLGDLAARIGLHDGDQLRFQIARRRDGAGAREPGGALEHVLLRRQRLLPDGVEEVAR
jgi:hypothetical protein